MIGIKKLISKARHIRKACMLKTIESQSSHIGSMFSVVDIMVYLYYKEMKKDDILILSKGHACLVQYAILFDKNIIHDLDYCMPNSELIGHCNHKVDGIKVSTGSLGHGLSLSIGLAMGDKSKRIFCILGDGEMQEGQIWEALIFLANNKIDNLIILIDGNKLQGYDHTEDIFPEKRLLKMLKATGLDVYEVDGHDFVKIDKIFKDKNACHSIIFLHTIKGKGIKELENKIESHYKTPILSMVDAL